MEIKKSLTYDYFLNKLIKKQAHSSWTRGSPTRTKTVGRDKASFTTPPPP